VTAPGVHIKKSSPKPFILNCISSFKPETKHLKKRSSCSYGSWIYNHLLWIRIPLRRGVLDTTFLWYGLVFQWLAADRWFSPGTPVSSTNKTDRHDIT